MRYDVVPGPEIAGGNLAEAVRRAPEPLRTTREEGVIVDHGPCLALQSILEGGDALEEGDPLPPLWHWAALATWKGSSELGPDGHPVRSPDFPPTEHPRRMFAGGEVHLLATVAVGERVTIESQYSGLTSKTGRSGPFDLVERRLRVYQKDGCLAIDERQDLIFRPAASADAPGQLIEPSELLGEPPLIQRSAGSWSWRTDPAVLMRFSAATANAHRIHYDSAYATQVEGYPGLVVHGPLMTLALSEALRHEAPPRKRLGRLRHRSMAPLFCGQSATVSTATTRTGQMVAQLRRGDVLCSTLEVDSVA